MRPIYTSKMTQLIKRSANVKVKEKPKVFIFIITTSLNNLFITLFSIDLKKTIFSLSTGNIGFKGSLKSKTFAATQLGLISANLFKKKYLKSHYSLIIEFKGHSRRRYSAFYAIKGSFSRNQLKGGGMLLRDVSIPPYNGCRKKKLRRV